MPHFNNEHINTKQNVDPTITNGTLSGNDIAGTIDFMSTGNSGVQTTITFRFPYKVPPVVVLTPQNMNSGVNNIGYFVTSTKFNFSIQASYTSGPIAHKFSYMVMQAE